jgi:hypothetical protein
MRHLFMSAGLAAALLLVPGAGAPSVTAASSVKITLHCYSNPEKTKITNVGTHSFKITKVGSTYQPYSYEPFRVSKTLAPGQSVTYQTGRAARGTNALTRNYIYNDNGKDGAKVVTSVGTFTKHC